MGNVGPRGETGINAHPAFHQQPRPELRGLRGPSRKSCTCRMFAFVSHCAVVFVAVKKEDRTGMFHDVVRQLLFVKVPGNVSDV